MKNLSFFLLFFCLSNIFAQIDSVKKIRHSPEFKFADGIFINADQLKKNNPLKKGKIVTEIPYEQIDFFEQLFQYKSISYYSDMGSLIEIETAKIWGYCENNKIYINLSSEFNRIPYMGTICHFIANKTVYDYPGTSPYGYNSYDPYLYPSSYNSSVEMRQYLYDFETDKVIDFDMNSVEAILIRDEELYEEFINLKKKEKKQKMFLYIRKYNEKHPLILEIDPN